MSLERVAEVTRIPLHSLELLEAGEFEALPGDVFVRGFITAYANCLKLDADKIVDRYTHCKAASPPQSLCLEAATIKANDPEPPTVPSNVLMQSQPRRRLGVTVAVILILIVATLTISYFLRSTDSTGDGVTMLRSALG